MPPAGSAAVARRPRPRAERDRQLFDCIAERYAGKDLYPPSRRARRARLEATLRALPPMDRPDVVELGCGAGFAADYLSGRYGTYRGYDHAATLVEFARRHNQFAGARFEIADVLELPPDPAADVVLMIGVLHHLDDPGRAVRVARSLLRPGGHVVVNEPQAANPLIGLARRARTSLDRSYSDDQRPMTAGELRRAFRDAGLVDVKVVPQGVLSTPFAEVPLRPEWAASAASTVACQLDRGLERALGRALRPVAWNLVAAGTNPGAR